jgi:hypothetical protein
MRCVCGLRRDILSRKSQSVELVIELIGELLIGPLQESLCELLLLEVGG